MNQDYFDANPIGFQELITYSGRTMSFLFRHFFILLMTGFLVLGSCGEDTPSGPEPEPEPPAPKEEDDGSDLSIRFIQRLPEIDYVWNSSNPAKEGWPLEDQEVTWRAYIINWAANKRDSVTYTWLLDGKEVAAGTVDFTAGGEVTVDFPWIWTFDRHELTFIIDPAEAFDESEERNNLRDIYTDALTIGFYVEQSLYDYFTANQQKLNVGSANFDDWAHRQIDNWNEMLNEAVYSTSPNGVLDRVRIDKITVVSDGALPLSPLVNIPPEDADASSHPNVKDRTVDMQWGFTAEEVSLFENRFTVVKNNPFYFHGTLLHELGHARYLTDVYAFRVYHGVNGDSVLIKENGIPIVGTPYMPGRVIRYTGPKGTEEGLILYRTDIQGLMNQNYTFIDRHSAAALNLIAGHRAVCGNYNEPCNIGSYLNDLPAENRLTIRSQEGDLLAGADVQIYQATGIPGYGTFYTRRINNIPDLQLTTDEKGQVLLGHNPFSHDQIRQDWEVSNTTAIIRVEHENRVGYNFLDVSKFNLAYWEGKTELADHQMTIQLIDGMTSSHDVY